MLDEIEDNIVLFFYRGVSGYFNAESFFFQERTQNFGHISQTDCERSVRGVARTVQLFAGDYYWNGLALNPQLTTGLPHK